MTSGAVGPRGSACSHCNAAGVYYVYRYSCVFIVYIQNAPFMCMTGVLVYLHHLCNYLEMCSHTYLLTQ